MLDLTQTTVSSPEVRAWSARPCIKANFSVEIVAPKHVYLLSEHGSHVLTGRLYCIVVPLLNGENSVADIYVRLSDTVSRDHIDHVILRLRRLGYLGDAVDGMAPGVAAFWSELGFDPARVDAWLRQSRVRLMAVGDVDLTPLAAMLTKAGLVVDHGRTREESALDLQVVVTDDYLRPELSDINRNALRAWRPWMIVKPVGSVTWLGPVFMPGETGCWQCLAHRLSGNVEVRSSILRQRQAATGTPDCVSTSRPVYPSVVDQALNWAATEAAKWIVAQSDAAYEGCEVRSSSLAGKILTFDHVTHACATHQLPHRPQCPCCGDPSLVSRRGFEPIVLQASPKCYVDDSGHRSMTPEQTLARHADLLSPVTGVVTELERISDPGNSLVHTYKASHSLGAIGSLRGLRQLLRHKSSGKGKTDAQSRASGFCEAIERYSFIYQGDEPRKSATLAELGERAIHPERCLHFSELQYLNRDTLNTASIGHDWIPMRFNPERAIDWTPVWSLTRQCQRFLPTAYCYLWAPVSEDHDFCRADSNGNAAGNTREEAILQGLLEVIERDCVSTWWYNRLRRPAVDLASFDDPYFQQLEKFYRDIGRELWVLDLTSDMNIPVVAAISRRSGDGAERLIIGYGAHLDPVIAITRALTEMSQVGLELDKVPDEAIDQDSAAWLLDARLDNKPYLVPDPILPTRQSGDFRSPRTSDTRDDVEFIVTTARRLVLEVLVLDLTRPDIGLSVVKVVVPGMRFFWQRFAPGRLYDVPVKLGWLKQPIPESGLNRTPMPF
ncbi:TOMM precursor leader peptide-binding protein [soil metagenome]